MVRSRPYSASASDSREARSRGPRSRSNGLAASSWARRPASAAATPSGRAERSIRGRRQGPGGAMTCAGWPSRSANVVRRASCRRTTSPRAASRAAGDTSPARRRALAMWYAVLPGARRSRNQSRSWAKEAGTGSRSGGRRGIATPAEELASCAATTLASRSSVGFSKSWRTDSSTPKAVRTRETSWVASREWPPRSKKSSWTPTRSWRSSSAQSPASTSSTGFRGAAPVSASCRRGAGNARRSTLPLGVTGRAGSSTTAAGTMEPGSRAARNARSRPARSGSAPGPGTT